MKQNKLKLIIMVLATFLLASGCRRAKKEIPNTMLTGQAVIAADEALMPLMNAELDVFQSAYSYASIDCRFVSEYDAINLLLQEKIRLAVVARPLNQTEIDFFNSIKIIPESIPLAYDAIAVIVHPENRVEEVTFAQISKIMSGEASEWSQIKDSRMTGNIRQIFDTKSSGIIRSLNDSLHLNNKISGDISFAGNSKNVIDQVASDPGAIGFVGFNWLSENESVKVQEMLGKVKLLAISSASIADSINSFKPSAANLYNHRYPLARKVYAIYTDPAASLARGFLAHLTSERGQKIIYRMGLKPEDDFQRLVKIRKD